MTEQQKRRIEDRLPTEKLDWEDPDIKAAKVGARLANAFAAAGAAFLRHTRTAAAMAAIPDTEPRQYVVVGTLPMIGKVLPAESVASTDWRPYHSALIQCAELLGNMPDGAPLTDLPHYLADKLEQLREAANQCIDAAIVEAGRAPLTAPAPLTDELIQRFASWIMANRPKHHIDHACARCVPHGDMVIEGFNCVYHEAVDVVGGIMPTTAKATPAAPVQASQAQAAEVRSQALEEAAKACETWGNAKVAKWADDPEMSEDAKARAWDALQCAAAIRSLAPSSTADKASEVRADYSIRPVKVERDENGWWSHPAIPNFDEDHKSFAAWVKAVGLETTYKMLESEGDEHPVYISYFALEEPSLAAWEPKPPEGEGWFTFSIHDTEDGPAWVWARRIAAPSTADSGNSGALGEGADVE